MSKFDIQTSTTQAAVRRSFALQVQDAPRVQSTLFDSPAAEISSSCAHAATQQQRRLAEDAIDITCTSCGAVVRTIAIERCTWCVLPRVPCAQCLQAAAAS
jgi:hypothetical protein